MMRFILAAALLALLPSSAQAVDCSSSLQSLIDAAPAGGTLLAPACTYRETVYVTKPLTLDGQNQAEIRGADVWSQWNGQTSVNTVPGLYWWNDPGRCADGTTQCIQPEQVFIDGQPAPFTLDTARHVVLGSSPVGHVVEVTTRPMWLYVQADNVTIKNFTMRYAGTDAQHGAIMNWGGPSADAWHSNLTLDNDHFLYAHAAAVGICCSGQTGVTVTNSDIGGAGQEGIAANGVSGLVVSNNYVHDSNLAGFNCDWECGGMKLVGVQNAQVLGNDVSHSATAIWFDIWASNALIQNNTVHDNSRVGVFYEISSNARITANTAYNNGLDGGYGYGGIVVATSANVEVDHNTAYGNLNDIFAFSQSRPDAPPGAGTGINVHDNVIGAPAPTSTPTQTPIPATPTPRPTSTPTPTATAVRCQVQVWLNGVSQGRKNC